MDAYGLHRMTVALSAIVVVGQILFTLSLNMAHQFPEQSTWLLNASLVGRLLFGIGGESLGVAQSTFTSRWFHHDGLSKGRNYLALAMGINLAVGR